MIIYFKLIFNIPLTIKEKEKEMARLTAKYEMYKEKRRVLARELNNG